MRHMMQNICKTQLDTRLDNYCRFYLFQSFVSSLLRQGRGLCMSSPDDRIAVETLPVLPWYYPLLVLWPFCGIRTFKSIILILIRFFKKKENISAFLMLTLKVPAVKTETVFLDEHHYHQTVV